MKPSPARSEEEEIETVLKEISRVVSSKTGIQLGERQKEMVSSRLKKRLLELHIGKFSDYYKYFLSNHNEELHTLLSLLTTHHTFFFREFRQFEFLRETLLPDLIGKIQRRGDQELRIWSAACSTGHEVYSLAMFLNRHLKEVKIPNLKINFSIFGSDVDSKSVSFAKNGVYRWDELKKVPPLYMDGNWARGTGQISDFVKAKKEIKSHCQFDVVNLIDLPKNFDSKKFDIIFCRNLFIYFSQEQIKSVTENLIRCLFPHGYLFVGMSESLMGMDLTLKNIGPSVYAHADVQELALNKPASTRLKVVCVDDSPSILTLLRKIFQEDSSFELVGTAKDGVEAEKVIRETKPDVITLDIHMPVLDGLGYLKKNFGPSHPAIVMVSSVPRESIDLALEAIKIGASDYVEKPSLSNFSEQADEIKIKLKSAYLSRKRNLPTKFLTQLNSPFSQTLRISSPDTKVRLSLVPFSSIDNLIQFLTDLPPNGPPLICLVDGMVNESLVTSMKTKIKGETGLLQSDQKTLLVGHVYLGELERDALTALSLCRGKKTSIQIFGAFSKKYTKITQQLHSSQVVIEDHPMNSGLDLKAEIVPVSSFPIVSTRFFGEGEVFQNAPTPTPKPTPIGRKRVLIVDDSRTVRELLTKILSTDSELEVVGTCELPSQVESAIIKTKPHVITLDIHMPEEDGVQLLKRLLPVYKIPTVIISSVEREEGPLVLSAFENGAVDYIQKPILHELSKITPIIIEKIKAASHAKIQVDKITSRKRAGKKTFLKSSLVVIGSSTGGTEALKVFLEGLPDEIPPILIVQHIPAHFSASLAKRFNELFSFEVKEAQAGDLVTSNRVLIAPGGFQMGVYKDQGQLKVKITDDPVVNSHKPSVNYLFDSVAKEVSENVFGIILTGMGSDGAKGLLKLRQQGARTIAQDEATSVVYGMPKAAYEIGAAEKVCPLQNIADVLVHEFLV